MPLVIGPATRQPGLIERRIGDAAVAVTVNGTELPRSAVGPVAIVRGRKRPDQRTEPAALTVTLATDQLAELPRLGDQVAVDLTPAAVAYFDVAAAAIPRFRGKVSDQSARPVAAVTGDARLTLIAAGTAAPLAGIDVGAGAWPAEPAGDRVDRILTAAAGDDPDLVVAFVDADPAPIAARDAGKAKAGSLLDELAVSSGGDLVELRDGRIAWHDPDHRRALAVSVQLTAAQVLTDALWQQGLAGLLNDVTVLYPGGSVRVVDDLAIATARYRAQQDVNTVLADEDAARSRGVDLVGRYGMPRWRLDQLPVELFRTVAPATAAALLELDFGDLVEVLGFPSTGPFVESRLYVEGSTETVTRDAYGLALNVSEYGLTGASPRWVDVPTGDVRYFDTRTREWVEIVDGLRWDDVPADLSWFGAASWDLPTGSNDRWADQAGDLHWSDVDPAVTWATY